MSTMSAQLVIKAPNQRIPDHIIDCELNWDVLKLKNHITEVYPTNPEAGQRYTLHLVCSQNAVSSPVRKNSTTASSQNMTNPSQSPSQLRQRSPANDDSLSSNNGVNVGPHIQPGANVAAPAMGVVSPEMVAQQMAAMQYFYAHYMAQFMQQAQFAGFPMAHPDFTSAVFSPATTPATPPIGMPAENVAPANLNRAQAVANENVRMNAQGGPLLDDEEDDLENRDWLDWFYIFSRAMVLFTILFFYSSLGRFMVVTGVAVLVYMYQGGWFGARLPQAQPVQQVLEDRQDAVNEQQGNDEVRQDVEYREPVSSPGNEDEEEIRNVMDLMDGNREPNHRSEPNAIQTFWLFLTSFFVSLIPEQPPPVNIN